MEGYVQRFHGAATEWVRAIAQACIAQSSLTDPTFHRSKATANLQPEICWLLSGRDRADCSISVDDLECMELNLSSTCSDELCEKFEISQRFSKASFGEASL